MDRDRLLWPALAMLLPLASAFVPFDRVVEEPRGPLVDASCNMETVEEANSQQVSAHTHSARSRAEP